MTDWRLRLLGVGNAAAVELGSAMATIERNGAPWLTIDCGGEGLSAYEAAYGDVPRALFMTHAHLDHIAGFERLFVSVWFDPAWRGRCLLYTSRPAAVRVGSCVQAQHLGAHGVGDMHRPGVRRDQQVGARQQGG